jgi:hydroxymethylbilane synthase
VLPIRGNVDTRLRRLKAGDYDAVILAAAGLKRSGLFDEAIMTPLPTDQLLPAAGQGALALQCHKDSKQVRDLLLTLNDSPTADTVTWERQVVQRLHGDCHSPIGALAEVHAGNVSLTAAVAARDGHPPVVRARVELPLKDGLDLARLVVQQLTDQGAEGLLR